MALGLLLCTVIAGTVFGVKIRDRDAGPGAPPSISESDRPEPPPPPSPGMSPVEADSQVREAWRESEEGRYQRPQGEALGDAEDIVRMGEDLTIGPGQTVRGDVVAVGGSVVVFGRVEGDVVAIGGDVDLRDDAVVEGDAVSVGGRIRRDPSARLGGQNVGMHFLPSSVFGWGRPDRGFPFMKVLFTGMKLIVLILAAWLLAVLMEKKVAAMSRHLEMNLWKDLLTGLAVLILTPAACVVLLITIVGIPVALLAPLVLALTLLIGYLIVASMVGRRIAKPAAGDKWAFIKAAAAGLVLFESIPLIGAILRSLGGPMHLLGIGITVFGYAAIWVSATFGLGALLVTRFGSHATGAAPGTDVSLPPAPQPALQ